MIGRMLVATFVVLGVLIFGSISAASKSPSVMLVIENVSAPAAVIDVVSDQMTATLLRRGFSVVPADATRELLLTEAAAAPSVPIDGALRIARHFGADYLMRAWVSVAGPSNSNACTWEVCYQGAPVILRASVLEVQTLMMSAPVTLRCHTGQGSRPLPSDPQTRPADSASASSTDHQAIARLVDSAVLHLEKAMRWLGR